MVISTIGRHSVCEHKYRIRLIFPFVFRFKDNRKDDIWLVDVSM